jgi:uncharacterized protein (DUF1501 family)
MTTHASSSDSSPAPTPTARRALLGRRSFLALAAGATVLPRWARAPIAPQGGLWNGLVYLNVDLEGGLDQSAWVDPRNDPTINHYPAPAAWAGNIAYAPLGNNGTFFDKYWSYCLAINGVSLGSLSHENCRRLQSTGANGSHPTMAALYAAVAGAGLPIPWLCRSGPAFSAGIATYSRDLGGIADPNLQQAGNTHNRWVRSGDLEIMLRHRRERLAALGGADNMPFEGRQIENLSNARETTGLLEELRAVLPPSFDHFSEAVADAHQILLTFQAGVTVAGTLSLPNWDAHFGYDALHPARLMVLTALLDYVWTKAEALGIAQRLVVHVSSDVGRAPFYNPIEGKDHHDVASNLIMMKNASWANRVVGMSGPRHEPLAVDPVTLQPSLGGVVLEPAHVHRALRRILGIQESSLAQRFEFDAAPVELIDTSASSPILP